MPYDTPLASAARSSTGRSGNLTVPSDANLRAELVVTASSTPTSLNVSVDHSNDGGNTWLSLAAFTQVGAVSSASQSLAIPAPNSGLISISWTVVGTSYTFSVTVRSISMTN